MTITVPLNTSLDFVQQSVGLGYFFDIQSFDS